MLAPEELVEAGPLGVEVVVDEVLDAPPHAADTKQSTQAIVQRE